MLALENSTNEVYSCYLWKKENYLFFVSPMLSLCCVTVFLRFQVLLSLPVYVKVCECSEGSSLAQSHSKADLRRASGALSERDLFSILVPELCLGTFQRYGAPGETRNGSSPSPYARCRMIQHTF